MISVGLLVAINWQALNVSVALLVGIGVPLAGFLGTAIWWFHRRVKKLEQKNRNRNSVIFGNENNPLSMGIVKEVQEVKEQVERLETKQTENRERQQEIVARLNKIEQLLTNNSDD